MRAIQRPVIRGLQFFYLLIFIAFLAEFAREFSTSKWPLVLTTTIAALIPIKIFITFLFAIAASIGSFTVGFIDREPVLMLLGLIASIVASNQLDLASYERSERSSLERAQSQRSELGPEE